MATVTRRKTKALGEAKKVTVPGEATGPRIKRGGAPPAEHLAADELGPEPEPKGGWKCEDCGEPISVAEHVQGGLCRRCDPEFAGRGDWEEVAEVEPPASRGAKQPSILEPFEMTSPNGGTYIYVGKLDDEDYWCFGARAFARKGVCHLSLPCGTEQGRFSTREVALQAGLNVLREWALNSGGWNTEQVAQIAEYQDPRPRKPQNALERSMTLGLAQAEREADAEQNGNGKKPRASREALLPPGATSTATPGGIEVNNPDGGADARQVPTPKAQRPKPKDAGKTPIREEATGTLPATEPARVKPGQTFLCPFAELAGNRFNPRENFAPEDLDDLGAKLKRDGQVQCVLVREAPTGRDSLRSIGGVLPAKWEIVAGQRRAMAAFRAKLPGVRVELIENCDDARACELAIAENRDRKDISQVEYARGLQKLADLKGLDPKGLAADQGLSEQHVRNLLRLLKTPEECQQLVIDGKIDGTHLRTAAPYLHVPAIAKELIKSLSKAKEKPSAEAWAEQVQDVVSVNSQKISRHVHTTDYRKQGTVTIGKNDPRWEQLDVVEVKIWNRVEKVALNGTLAAEILDEKEADWRKKNKSKSTSPEGESAAEKRRKAEEARRQRTERLKGIVAHWKAWLCSRAIRENSSLANVVMLAVAVGADLPNEHDPKWNASKLLKTKKTFPESADLLRLDVDQLDAFVVDAACAAFWDGSAVEELGRRSYYLPHNLAAEVDTWVKALKVDVLKEWRSKGTDGKQVFLGPLTDAWLSLADVRELAEEWKVPVLDKETEPDLRRKLVSNAARVMPMPAELAELLKSPKAAKAKRKAK